MWTVFFAVMFFMSLFRSLYGWCYSKVCLVGKTAIVTGGNSGIGYQAALSLASRGCRVIIADVVDSARTVQTIIEETNNPNIISKKLDLQSFQSVRDFARDIIDTEPMVHILINNAGIGSYSLKFTEDGLHRTLQVNYYSHFLLTHLLLDLLQKSAPSRIIFTSSLAAFLTKLNLEDMNRLEHKPFWTNVYSNSKLLITIAANEFAEKLRGTGVTVNSFHPGGVRSKIFLKSLTEEPSFFTFLAWLITLIFGKNCEQGAQTLIHLACGKEVENVSGHFFNNNMKCVQPWQTYNKEFCKKVWDLSMKYTGIDSKLS